MARFDMADVDWFMIDFEELCTMPNSVIEEILMVEADVVAKGHRAELEAEGLVASGKLKSSIQIHKKRSLGSPYALIYPYGTHHMYNSRLYSYTKMNWGRAGGTASAGGVGREATNNDVGFVLEFGASKRHIPAHQWMRKANEKYADKAIDAAEKVYNEYLNKKGF